jgi:hypothetical protein
MKISCSCGASNTLEGISDGTLPQKCKGYQPAEKPTGCYDDAGQQSPMWMEPRGSSALHFASVMSALDIAQAGIGSEVARKLAVDRMFKRDVEFARKQLTIGQIEIAELEELYFDRVVYIADDLNLDASASWEVFKREVISDEGSQNQDAGNVEELNQRDILGDEFPVLSSENGFAGSSLTCVASPPPATFKLDNLLERVVQVERLREVRVFRGFQRRDITEECAFITPDFGTNSTSWLPAIEVSGEGIFLQFSSEALGHWLDENRDAIDQFTSIQLKAAEENDLPRRMGFNANPVFVMVHTFAHMLINQLSFDCGYSSTSLRERIYCGPESNLYAGVLIFTADSDSEGSMGGLVEMGSPDRISEVVYRAVSRSEWCSGDPVCREIESQGIGGMNRSACHACSLVAETSCTYSNTLLNRLLVSGRGMVNGHGICEPVGYFAGVIDQAMGK